MEEINRMPVVKNIIKENQINKEQLEEDINNLPHIKEYYKNLDDPAVQQEFEKILFPLEKMGYKQKLIFRSFVVFRYQDIADAIDLLSKTNGVWNHKFISGFPNKCFICEDLQKNHIGFYKDKFENEDEHQLFERKDSLRPFNIGSEKINEALKRMKSINTSLNNIEIQSENDSYNHSETCPICILELQDNNKIILGCKHKFCRDCIISYLEEEIKNSRIDPIKCPEKKCFKANADDNFHDYDKIIEKEKTNYFIFSDDLIKSLVSNIYYEKYLDFKLKLLIEKDKNLTFCPVANCKGYAKIDSALVNNAILISELSNVKDNKNINKSKEENLIDTDKNSEENDKLLDEEKINNKFSQSNTILNVSVDGQNKKKLICNFNHEFCFRCKNNWNQNHCCEKDEELFKYSNKNANKLKKCPNCRTWIEKNSGCNHMTCFLCKYEFCWICMKECLPDHFNVIGSECYGKQFPDEDMDPHLRAAMNDLNNTSDFFFVFKFTFLCLVYSHRLYFSLNVNNNNDNNVQNNNNNANIEENNNILINVENDDNFNNNAMNVNEENQNAVLNQRENIGRNKCIYFTMVFIVLFIIWFMFLFLNGIILFSMIKCLRTISPNGIQNQNVLNRIRSATCLIISSYFIIWTVFFLPGLFITTFWFLISVLYLFWVMISR